MRVPGEVPRVASAKLARLRLALLDSRPPVPRKHPVGHQQTGGRHNATPEVSVDEKTGAGRLRGVADQLAADGFFDFFARPTVVRCESLD